MTAHDSVLTALRRYFMYADDAVDTLQAYRREVRTEVLREAAAKIRDAEAHREGGEWLDTVSGLLDAADLIDPDKES